MNTSRRSFLKGLLAAPLVPVLARVPLPIRRRVRACTDAVLDRIMSDTWKAKRRTIINQVYKVTPLFEYIRKSQEDADRVTGIPRFEGKSFLRRRTSAREAYWIQKARNGR